ncbi:Uma2 family endonuclease [Actinokineospora inagensis]|uniref:Uma2 family endonuclease n=1 Tax=Actinokineospora inagensis TaxID=103730 RepID=UPI001FE0393B|nr:Uma2 family endonuclease [Actinokineospora inagensis]
MSSIEAHSGRRLTLQQYASLPSDSFVYELDEGILRVSARPSHRHQYANSRLSNLIFPQLPPFLLAFNDVDVNLDFPLPTVRAPDLIITPAETFHSDSIHARDVLLAVEIHSPSTKRVDLFTKPAQYAKAGIPNLWLIDPGPPLTARVFELTHGFYRETTQTSGILKVNRPTPLHIDLRDLVCDPWTG